MRPNVKMFCHTIAEVDGVSKYIVGFSLEGIQKLCRAVDYSQKPPVEKFIPSGVVMAVCRTDANV